MSSSSNLFLVGVILLLGFTLRGIFSQLPNSVQDVEGKKGTIMELRAMLDNDLPHSYMKDDAYLLRYLTAQNFNLEKASQRIKENLIWRKAENVDSILEEDWSDFEKRFPYQISTVNKEGRPILYYPAGAWDFSNDVVTGTSEKFARYAGIKLLEDADRKVHAMRGLEAFKDVGQFDIIVDLEGYTLDKHGCMQCLQMYRDLMQKSEAYYKEAGKNVFFINAPIVFEAVYPYLASGLLEDKTRDAIKVLGGKASFEPILLQYIDKDQFPKGI